MAGKSKREAVPEHVLRDVFLAGLQEIARAGITVRCANTGTAMVVLVEAWRLCSICGQILLPEGMANLTTCRTCAGEDVPDEGQP